MGAFGLNHWNSRYYKDEIPLLINGRPGASVPLTNLLGSEEAEIVARKGLIAEQCLTYNAAKPAIDEVGRLLRDEKRLEQILKEAYGRVYGTEAEFQSELARLTRVNARNAKPLSEGQLRDRARRLVDDKIHECVIETIDTLKKRFGRLDEVMKTLNKRNGIPLQVSDLRLFDDEDLLRRAA